jgi:hypothetical protein
VCHTRLQSSAEGAHDRFRFGFRVFKIVLQFPHALLYAADSINPFYNTHVASKIVLVILNRVVKGQVY